MEVILNITVYAQTWPLFRCPDDNLIISSTHT